MLELTSWLAILQRYKYTYVGTDQLTSYITEVYKYTYVGTYQLTSYITEVYKYTYVGTCQLTNYITEVVSGVGKIIVSQILSDETMGISW